MLAKFLISLGVAIAAFIGMSVVVYLFLRRADGIDLTKLFTVSAQVFCSLFFVSYICGSSAGERIFGLAFLLTMFYLMVINLWRKRPY